MNWRLALPLCWWLLAAACSGAATSPEGVTGNVGPPVQGACGFTVPRDQATRTLDADGDSVTVAVTAAADCTWHVELNSDFVTVADAGSGSGNGTVTLTVARNFSDQRTASVTIAGVTFTITQRAAPCAFAFAGDTERTFGSSGGSGSVTITVTRGSNCSWTARSDTPAFITLTSATSGTGNATIAFTVAMNTLARRTGTLTIAGQTVSVNQDGAANAGSPQALTISNVRADVRSSTMATIAWHVSQPATGQVEYGLTTSYGLTSVLESSFSYVDHSQELANLTPGRTYHFRVKSTDQSGQSALSGDFVFDTPANAAPAISGVKAEVRSATSATISWHVSQPATGQVEYGLTTSYGLMSVLESSFNYVDHSQELTNLSPGRTYHFRVKSQIQSGQSVVSGDFTFETPPAGPLLTISDVRAEVRSATAATISWHVSQPATGQVEYGPTTGYGSVSTLESSFNYTDHSQELTNLTPATLYHFRVKSQGQSGPPVTSGDATFTTR